MRELRKTRLGIEALAGLGKLQASGLDLAEAKQFASAALQAIREGRLGFQVPVARKDA